MTKENKTAFTEVEFISLVDQFEGRAFSTFDFIQLVKTTHPKAWHAFVSEYGEGGKGAGKHYSAYSRLAHILFFWSKRGAIDRLDYVKAPKSANWGNPVIRYWAKDKNSIKGPLIPEEDVPTGKRTYDEGAVVQVMVNSYERDPAARRACIAHYGATCAVCHFDFGKRYGKRGEGYIHVHHKTALYRSSGRRKTDPIADLVPVCPNCHAMLHAVQDDLTVEDLSSMLL